MRRAPEEPVDEVPATLADQRLRRESRVRRHSEYRVIQARGRRVHSAHYVWIVMPRPPAALGVSPAPNDPRAPITAAPAASSEPRAWIIAAPCAPGEPRLGITITKKTAQRAVDRNRVKRVVRAVFRKERALFPPGCDVVVIGKSGAEKLGYADVLAELRGVARKLAAAGGGAARGADGRAGEGGQRSSDAPRRNA
jgi:ribonuclease P protein component